MRCRWCAARKELVHSATALWRAALIKEPAGKGKRLANGIPCRDGQAAVGTISAQDQSPVRAAFNSNIGSGILQDGRFATVDGKSELARQVQIFGPAQGLRQILCDLMAVVARAPERGERDVAARLCACVLIHQPQSAQPVDQMLGGRLRECRAAAGLRAPRYPPDRSHAPETDPPDRAPVQG